MANVVSALVRSRKAWVLLLAVAGVVAMNALGKVPGDQALEFIKWLVSAWFLAVAAEDAAEKSAPKLAGFEVATSESSKTDPPRT